MGNCYDHIAKQSITQTQPLQVRKTHTRHSEFYLFRVNQHFIKWECQEGHTGEETSSLCDTDVKKSSCTNQLLSREGYLGKMTNYNHTPLYRAASEFGNL